MPCGLSTTVKLTPEDSSARRIRVDAGFCPNHHEIVRGIHAYLWPKPVTPTGCVNQEVFTLSVAGTVITLSEHVHSMRGVVVLSPRYDEIAGCADPNIRKSVRRRGGNGVDLEFITDWISATVKLSCRDADGKRRPVDDKVTGRIRANALERRRLTGRSLVYLEVVPDRNSAFVEKPTDDVTTASPPNNDKIARGGDRDAGANLIVGRVRVDLEAVAERIPGTIKSTRLNSIT